MQLQARRIFRLSLTTALALACAYALRMPLAFLAPLFAFMLMSKPGPPVGVKNLFGLVLLVLALLAAMAFVLTRTGPLAPTRITVTEVAAGRLQPSIFGIGTVEAQRSALIGPTVPGRVLSVAVFEHVEALEFADAHRLSAGMVVFALVVLLAMTLANRRAGRALAGT